MFTVWGVIDMSAKYPVGTRLKCVGPIFSSFFEEYATVRMSQRHGLGVRFDSYEYNPDDQHSLEDFVWEVVTKPKPKGLVAFLRKHEEKT
jgi:hypothetical protein